MAFDQRRAVSDAFAAFQSGDHEKAEKILLAALSSARDKVTILIALGMIAGSAGRTTDAMARMHEALRIDKNCVAALNWLSKLANDSGDADKALEFAERAVAISPQNPESLMLRAGALFRQQRYRDSLMAYEYAIKLSPDQALLHYRKAEVLEVLVRETSAVDELEIAIRLAPSQEGLSKLAQLQLHIGRPEDAVATSERLLREHDEDPGAHVLMARALIETLEYEKANSHWLRAQELEPQSAGIRLQKARSLGTLGMFDEASIELVKAIELDEKAGSAYHAYVSAKKITDQDLPLIDQMERVLGDSSLDDDSRIKILYALGKSYDNLGDYQRAMAKFDEGNKMEYELYMSPFEPELLTSYVNLQISTFTPEFFEKAQQEGLKSDLPLFVIGMMRSGTTLAEQVLTCHSQIGGSGEQAFWSEMAPSVVNMRRGTARPGKAQAAGTEYLALLNRLAPGFRHVIDKNPGNAMVVGTLHFAFPNSKFIHMQRNPIDNALSIWMTQMRTSAEFVCNRENIVFAYREYLRLMEHWRSIIPASHFLDVQYEDLIAEPETVTARMTDFIGLEWEEACVHPENNPQAVRTPSFFQVRQPFYKASADRWKRYEPWLGAFLELADIGRL